MSDERKAGRVVLRNYVLPQSVPKAVSFGANAIKFSGLISSEVCPGTVWGVYGTDSINRCDGYASQDAQHLKRRLYQVDLVYVLPRMPANSTVLTEEEAKESGYIYFDRLEKGYRERLRDEMLGHLLETSDLEIESLVKENLATLLRRRPMLVHRFMNENPQFKVALYTVDLPGGVQARIGLVRVLPEHVQQVSVRYNPEIVATI